MLRTLGQGESTKWIIPMEFANVAKSIGDRLMAMTGSSGSADGEGRSSKEPGGAPAGAAGPEILPVLGA